MDDSPRMLLSSSCVGRRRPIERVGGKALSVGTSTHLRVFGFSLGWELKRAAALSSGTALVDLMRAVLFIGHKAIIPIPYAACENRKALASKRRSTDLLPSHQQQCRCGKSALSILVSQKRDTASSEQHTCHTFVARGKKCSKKRRDCHRKWSK